MYDKYLEIIKAVSEFENRVNIITQYLITELEKYFDCNTIYIQFYSTHLTIRITHSYKIIYKYNNKEIILDNQYNTPVDTDLQYIFAVFEKFSVNDFEAIVLFKDGAYYR